MRVGSAVTSGRSAGRATDELDLLRFERSAQGIGGAGGQDVRGDGMQFHQGPAGFDAGHVKQVFDNRVQPLGVVAGGVEQLLLLGAQRADALLGDQVQDHAHAGERRLELVADQGEQAVLHFVQPAQAGDVGQHDGGADGLLRFAGDRDGAGEEKPGFAGVFDLQGGFISAGSGGVARAENLLMQIGQPGRLHPRDADAGDEMKEALGGFVGQLDAAIGV